MNHKLQITGYTLKKIKCQIPTSFKYQKQAFIFLKIPFFQNHSPVNNDKK